VQQTLSFGGAQPEWSVSFDNVSDSVRDMGQHDDVSLGQFCERPIFTTTYSWPVGGTFSGFVIDPWSTFFTNKRVINRINNFNLLSANLHVKFVINGNGFYYGSMMADYLPLATSDFVTAANIISLSAAVGASQRMNVLLDPTTSQGGELTLPFTWFADQLSVPDADWTNMGFISVRELVPLKHANAGTAPIEINVSLWATDVKLSVPTSLSSTALVPQAGFGSSDEYGTTSVSLIASAAAKAMSMLEGIPVIGPYMKATSMIATAVSKVARVFGYSRPVIVDDVTNMRPRFLGRMAVCDGGDNATKLTVDSKQELSIDPRICGVDTGDEMVISSIAARPAFTTQFLWTTAKVKDDLLFNIRVNPLTYLYLAPYFYLPACAFAAVPFKMWRGTMKYRFQVVASAYHKGRLLITWDPNFSTVAPETNVVYSRIVDLAEERDFTIDVGMGQTRSFLPARALSATPVYSTTRYATSSQTDNGVLSVFVLNSLATPNTVANNDITVNVFTSMECAEFGNPCEAIYKNMAYQAGFEEGESDAAPPSESQPINATLNPCTDSPDINLVYFGESIVSFRTLLKRYSLHSYVFRPPPTTATDRVSWSVNLPDKPLARGTYPTGIHTSVAATPCNYVTTGILQYLEPAFLCQRGSYRSKYVVSSSGTLFETMTVLRQPDVASYVNTLTSLQAAVVTATDSAFSKLATATMPNNMTGAEVTIPRLQPVIEVEHPYQRNIRFSPAKDPGFQSLYNNGSIYNAHHTIVSTGVINAPQILTRYVSVGEDYQLTMFQGAPPMYNFLL